MTPRLPLVIAGVLVCVVALVTGTSAQAPTAPGGSITDVPGILVGQHTLTERPTGCTVVLAPPKTVGGYDQPGGAPATRETNLLAPENSVDVVHAITLSGGSAYGLDSASGVMRFLREQKVGYPISGTVVPIVPGASILDLAVGGKPEITPGADCGYRAASSAASGPVAEGSVGAGAGATVGKFAGTRPMKGGVGTTSLRGPNGLIVGALMVVNAAGTVYDRRTGQAIAGVRTPDGSGVANPFELIRAPGELEPMELSNTTIGVVATNAQLTKAQALRVAIMAQDGFARAIFPSHTPGDGDTIFVLATGAIGPASVSRVGSLASEAVSDAIIRAVMQATGVPGYPAVRDLRR